MATAVAGALGDDDLGIKPTESLFNGTGSNASLPGLLLALMTLFDTDGSHTLTEREWRDGNTALDLATSHEEWKMLLARFDEDESNPGESALPTSWICSETSPVEGYLEEICAGT